MDYKSKDQVVMLMKEEITRLVLDLTIPVNVKTFGELHDYIDANELGNMCTEEFDKAWGRTPGDEGPETDAMMEFCNECQMEVHEWIVDGDLQTRIEDESQENFTPWAYGDLLTKYKSLLQAVDAATSTPFAPDNGQLARLRMVWVAHRGAR